jgi:SMC interacting uncharacterized protein involved in chromosome segregation
MAKFEQFLMKKLVDNYETRIQSYETSIKNLKSEIKVLKKQVSAQNEIYREFEKFKLEKEKLEERNMQHVQGYEVENFYRIGIL